MLFECNNPINELVSVAHLCWKGDTFDVDARPYSALAFRIKGEGEFVCGDDIFFVGTNDILYIPQGMSYKVEYSDTDMYVIHFITKIQNTTYEIYRIDNINEIYSLFLKANMVWEKKDAGYRAESLSILYKIFSVIEKSVTKSKIPQYFSNAVSFINENFRDSSLSIEKICKNCGCGQTQLRKMFKEFYNTTPIEYITNLRLEFAKNLIAENASVELASTLSGFNDSKYFSRVVKQKYGCRPKDFKLFGK